MTKYGDTDETMTLRIVICCSNNLFAEGLKNLLAKEADIEIIGIFHGNDLLGELGEAVYEFVEPEPHAAS